MIHGMLSRFYDGALDIPILRERALAEVLFEQGSGDIKVEFTTNQINWVTVLNTATNLNTLSEELLIPEDYQGNGFQFRIEIDIDPSIPDIDFEGYDVWGFSASGREAEQVNFFNFETKAREAWTTTKKEGLWRINLPPGRYFIKFDSQDKMTLEELPDNQFIVVGSGTLANRFGDDIQVTFKNADRVFLTSLLSQFHWARHLFMDLGLDRPELRVADAYATPLLIREGRIYKGDAWIALAGFFIGRS